MASSPLAFIVTPCYTIGSAKETLLLTALIMNNYDEDDKWSNDQ